MVASERRLKVWAGLVGKWARRILCDPGWVITVKWDSEVETTAEADTDRAEYREGSVRLRPDTEPDNRIACHEVLHIALAGMSWTGPLAMEEVAAGVGASVFSTWQQQAEEACVEGLTRAFVLAYAEQDTNEPDVRRSQGEQKGVCIVTMP